ncbi:eCIS core domain-containing protein [Candidatus Promineifilum breve]|uniref:eCIS core domain-containing protein n=1 Tax=Candidatus Promineifilum breve TaxID=1806508 RepID=UPI00138FF867|nr:DUF4157 domain-containing protein [Candidatus Promineifilum breve]
MQRKMAVNAPGDAFEQEADQVARAHLQRQAEETATGPTAAPVQRKLDEATPVQRQMDDETDTASIHRQGAGAAVPEVTPEIESGIEGARGGGSALPPGVQRSMENTLGADLSGVRVHSDGRADRLSRQLDARAFTSGQDIFFKQGEYNPGSRGGEELLAHEMAHVVQQGGGASQVQRNGNQPAAADQIPGPVQVNWAGDPFTISFERRKENSVDSFIFIIRYTGPFRVDGPGVENGTVRRVVALGQAPLNASVVPLPGQQVVVDLYGYRDHLVKVVDNVEYDDRPSSRGRAHTMVSKSQGKATHVGTLWVHDPKAKPLAKTDAEPALPAFSSAGRPVFIGGVSSVDVTLGPHNDQFRLTLQSNATSLTPTFPVNARFGITPLYRGQPVFGRGMEVPVKANPSITVLSAADGGVTLDVDRDQKVDLQINDTISASTSNGNNSVEFDRDHTIAVTGAGISPKTFKFMVRYGSFVRGESPEAVDKAATSNAFAVGELTKLRGETGSFEEQFARTEAALMPIRKNAYEQHLITERTYNAWFALSQAMIRLRPQILAHQQAPQTSQVDQTLLDSAATQATQLYDALAEETKSRNTISGPRDSVAANLRDKQWEQAFGNYNRLISGLDRWVVTRLKETKGEKDESVQQAEGLAAQREALGKIEGRRPIRVVAVFHPDSKFSHEPGYKDSFPLALYAWKDGDSWILQDQTNPKQPYTFPSVAAKQGEEPPVALFSELSDPDHYPEGVIHFEMPGKYAGQQRVKDRLTWKEFFTWLGIGLVVIGLTLTTFGTGTVAVAGSWALAASAVAGGTAAGIDLVEGMLRGNMTTTRAILDIAQIVASLAGVSALRAGRVVQGAMTSAKSGTPLMGKAAEYAVHMNKVYVVAVGTNVAADAVTVVTFSVEVAQQLDEIERSQVPQEEKNRAKYMLLTQLALTGGLAGLSIKGSLPALRGNRSLVLHFPDNQGPPVATIGGMESPTAIRFSQADIAPTTGDAKMTLEELADSIRKGWQGPPIDVVEMPDGTLTSLDNRRLRAAQMAGVKDIPVAYHHPTEQFPPARANTSQFELKKPIRQLQDGNLVVGGTKGDIVYPKGFRPTNYGEAIMVRTANQKPATGGPFPLEGSFAPPRVRPASPRTTPTEKTPAQMGTEIGQVAKNQGGTPVLAERLSGLNLPQAQGTEATEAALWATGMRPARPVVLSNGDVAIPIAQEGRGQPVMIIKPDGRIQSGRADLQWDLKTWRMNVESVRVE